MKHQSDSFPTEEMYSFPNIVNVEVYRGNCPASCVHCPVGETGVSERTSKFGEKSMDLALFTKIVDEVSEHKHATLRIHSVGEPLLWKNLPDALTIAASKAVRSWIFTSAITIDRSLLETISKNTTILEVSVNSIEAGDYRATKGVEAFELVKSNIEYLHRFIAKQNLYTRLLVSRVQSSDIHADEAFVAYWKATGLVNDAFVRSYHTYNDLLSDFPEGNYKKQKAGPCLVHWARFNISVDGYAVVCFNELFKRELDLSLVLGDVRKETISQIWHGGKLLALRKAEIQKQYSGLSFSKKLPCKNCMFCQPLFGQRQTSEYQIKEINGNV